MVAPRTGQTATLLQNGQVLVAGGGTASAELFNPSTGTFTATGSMMVSRAEQTATLLLDGRVLIAGGVAATGPALVSSEPYDPVSGMFTAAGSMSEGTLWAYSDVAGRRYSPGHRNGQLGRAIPASGPEPSQWLVKLSTGSGATGDTA